MTPDGNVEVAAATAHSLGRKLDVVNGYQAWAYADALPTEWMAEVTGAGAVPEITWEPWDPTLGLNQPSYALSTISGRAHDAYINTWAKAAAAYGKPIMLRFAHEMNGNWYPWAPTVNGGSAAGYVAAYRHVVDLFRAANATNVIWVWSPNLSPWMPTSLASVYPGDAYVDVIGIDGYNGGTDVPGMGGWRTPQDVFGPTLTTIQQLAPNKRVIINETGSSENGGDKASWISQLFAYLTTSHVSGIVWFDVDKEANWRLMSSSASFASAKAALANW